MVRITRRVLMAGLGVGVGLVQATRAYAQAKKIQVGEIAPIGIFWPGMIGLKENFYAAEGIQVDLNYVGSNTASVQQLVGGSLDITLATCEVALQAIEKGADISILGGTAVKYPYSMMSAKDVKTAADIKGKKVMLAVPHQDLDIFFDRWLKSNGLTPQDVDKVFDGATPNRYAALASGAVAAAAVSQPFDFRAAAEGYNKLVDFGVFVENYAFVVILSRKSWLKDNTATAKSYLRAVSRSIDWFYDLANRDAAIDILSTASKQDKATIAKTYDYYQELKPFSRHLELSKASVQNVADTMAQVGALKAPQQAIAGLDLSLAPR
jgi:NitT/TauT family transport system substrate-binding protein